MELIKDTQLHGFTVDRVRRLEEIEGDLIEMHHEKTGAQLCWFRSSEENKLFSVSFKTLPENDTGVFHILEHSVLGGSDKYPVREPFVELLKGSMNTFLNAMTASDMTIYPVSSRNVRDFLNLTSVYLDAVFAPAILRNENIFRQEGWHIELNEVDGTPIYKGVVFNEMKGATASVDDVVMEGCTQLIFPDNCYHYNSGGDPEHIPELTYEQFKETYRRFYNPSNARFWLDGDLPIDDTLALIDSYLDRFDRSGEVHEIARQAVLPPRELHLQYSISPEEDAADKTQIVLAKLADERDSVEWLAAEVLCDVVAGSNDAPLTRAILERGLGQDVSMDLNTDYMQNLFTLQIHNTEEDRLPAIRETVREIAEKLVREGIDRAELEASLNHAVFRMKEPAEPQGLLRAFKALSAWNYDGDPATYLTCDPLIAALREKLDTPYFEELLSHLLLEDDLSLLCVTPSATLGEEKRAAEAEKLAALQATWTDADKQALVEMNRELTRWQQTPDTPEQLATLPQLPLSEVDASVNDDVCEVSTEDGVTLLYHKEPSNGIVHLNLYFRLTDCTAEELTRMSLLASLLSELPTKNYSALALQREIKLVTGHLTFGINVSSPGRSQTECAPLMTVSASVLNEYVPRALALIHEILVMTDFSDAGRIRELMLQADDDMQQAVLMSGNSFAANRAGAHFSAAVAAREAITGITAVRYLHKLAKQSTKELAAMGSLFQEDARRIFTAGRLIASVTASEPVSLSALLSRLPAGEAVPEWTCYHVDYPLNEAIRIPSQINYAAAAAHTAMTGSRDHGSMNVLSTILTYSYLWNRVRVQGGAYGVSFRCGSTGMMAAGSYRDPSAAGTLAAYRGMSDFVREFCAGSEPVEKFIISTIAHASPLMTVRSKAAMHDTRYLDGITKEIRAATRREVIDTTREDLLSWCDALDSVMQQGAVCVIGFSEAIDKCSEYQLVVSDL